MENLSEEELQEMSQQLSCPSGEKGVAVAEMLNETNIGMTRETVRALGIQNDNEVLELGPGNAAHLLEVLGQGSDVIYYGLEISETMQKEAMHINKKYLEQNKAAFKLYDGEIIPYPDNAFDRIFTVNTIYFWHEPIQLLNEIYRVLKPGGVVCIAYVQKAFMKQLPFVKHQFRLFDNNDIRSVVDKTAFNLETILDKTEQVKIKSGELIDRYYSVAVLKK